MTDAPARSHARSWLRFPIDNWPSRIYLLLVAAAVVFFLVDQSVTRPDASFAAIYMLILTAPISLLASIPLIGVAVGALLNATLIGALAHLARNRR
ncbi:hypothetical protein Ais01nite_35030 [Asanoa ishikariensis]|uniref:Uncharacterized protein n=1 Tax=Asanoa ishikariensis TaxID=137265 RepID=A0A1H3LHU1_9ACTN|nr:hypothetical protein [Asanoa ishikariensis]GIF65468.1 hypothetical protein Ais01nite_35030 [Asanoa ishikariensis]SDY63504.1 hypothetical protein SAMN05421684_0744 [Asanoa ishikariensis]